MPTRPNDIIDQLDPLLDTAQAAEYLGLRPQTLAAWRCLGRYSIPYIRVGAHIRYRRSQLEKWVMARTVTPTTGASHG